MGSIRWTFKPQRSISHQSSVIMSCYAKIVFLFAIASVAASDEKFSIWMKGPQADMCLNTNITITGLTNLITPAGPATCCRFCQDQDVCSIERNTSKIICGYNPTIAQMCMKE